MARTDRRVGNRRRSSLAVRVLDPLLICVYLFFSVCPRLRLRWCSPVCFLAFVSAIDSSSSFYLPVNCPAYTGVWHVGYMYSQFMFDPVRPPCPLFFLHTGLNSTSLSLLALISLSLFFGNCAWGFLLSNHEGVSNLWSRRGAALHADDSYTYLRRWCNWYKPRSVLWR